jgi:hypothetical protein
MSDSEDNNKPTSKQAPKDDGEIPTEVSPGEAYMIFIEMNNLSNKLKLLNYEDEYLLKWKMKPLSRYFLGSPGKKKLL